MNKKEQESTCQTCKKVFQYFPSQKDGKYCSKPCWIASNYKVRICKRCNKKFVIGQTKDARSLCSRTCSVKKEPEKAVITDLDSSPIVVIQKKSWWQSIKNIFVGKR